MLSHSQSAFSGEQGQGARAGSAEGPLHSALAAESETETNQAERAAMHPEGHDLEWRYYHCACYA